MLRTARCKHCKVKFLPEELGRALHPQCIDPWIAERQKKEAVKKERARKAQEKVEKAQHRQKKRANKKTSDIEEECRRIVQKIARIRDRNLGCVSCDKPANWQGQWHGSHYRSHGACSALQFHLWNINKACWICNKIFSGRIDGYKTGLAERYGVERVEWLDSQPKSRPYDPAYREYLDRFKKVMGKRLRRMEKKAKEQE